MARSRCLCVAQAGSLVSSVRLQVWIAQRKCASSKLARSASLCVMHLDSLRVPVCLVRWLVAQAGSLALSVRLMSWLAQILCASTSLALECLRRTPWFACGTPCISRDGSLDLLARFPSLGIEGLWLAPSLGASTSLSRSASMCVAASGSLRQPVRRGLWLTPSASSAAGCSGNARRARSPRDAPADAPSRSCSRSDGSATGTA